MTNQPNTSSLNTLVHRLESLASSYEGTGYRVPHLWIDPQGESGKAVEVNPYRFYLDQIDTVKTLEPRKVPLDHWSRRAVVFNAFVRTTTAFDHDGSGRLETVNNRGFRELGTFVKTLALLPYIYHLGANVLYLLPVTAIGKDGAKGRLGSPYAIQNPYRLDENLGEPSLELDLETQLGALVEGAHLLGMKVVLEFVFRTSALDGDWAAEHPHWYYWIRSDIENRKPGERDVEKYGAPSFADQVLTRIKAKVKDEDFVDLPVPSTTYQKMFASPPAPENVEKQGVSYRGTTERGVEVRIPGAFADWPPDDIQPPWDDVTYLRMHHHPDFNYMAYNTLRMYDEKLTDPQWANRELWDRITGIIPHYQSTFAIDGVMIDMGHALPPALKQQMAEAARENNPHFVFWDENFDVTEQSREEGYDAVIGHCWADQHLPGPFQMLMWKFDRKGFPVPFFATPESHNTPRAASRKGGRVFSRFAWTVNNFIPAIPFIHSGFELLETQPINTGLGFTPEEIAQYPSDDLPLFSEYQLNWQEANPLVTYMTKISRLREKYTSLVTDPDPKTTTMISTGHPQVMAFSRQKKDFPFQLYFVANLNFTEPTAAEFAMAAQAIRGTDLLDGQPVSLEDGVFTQTLEPGQCVLIEIPQEEI